MYWSSNHDDKQSAVLRSVSGGPIYISDAPGNTNAANVWPLIYSDGTIIRCEARQTDGGLPADRSAEQRTAEAVETAGGAGIVAAFHIERARAR